VTSSTTAAARGSSEPFPRDTLRPSSEDAPSAANENGVASTHAMPATRGLTVVIAVPTLDIGAADLGALDLVRILAGAGHHPIVVSSGGRLAPTVGTAGAELISLDVASKNPLVIARNGLALVRLIYERGCDVVHAHGRTAAWSALIASRITRIPLITSWYKGFREQNPIKRLYNGVMVSGERVVAISDQIAELIAERHRTPSERIVVIPAVVDFDRFDPENVNLERVAAVREEWGARNNTKIILVVGRMLRRKGHHVVVRAVRRLKAIGLKDFLCVFAGEDQGRSRYTGEIWDLILATDTTDVIRLAGAVTDLPAAFAAATVVVSAAIQPEGLQRAILEALAMRNPVVVSDLAAGPDVVLAPPAVSEDRITGLRVASGDDRALAAALIRIFSMPEAARQAIGTRGREWVLSQFNPATVTAQTLALYAEIAATRRSAADRR
jgi:glycosyltransferase involved in cell wall biosynthesis